ncbi:hypothetical protein BpHYR1_037590 [Brachionus plicatilis]|uniref:Uncharacterized protein n=1 Tax=Brachionus plicatilis TaxID=10195 RepID=A0A3M7SBL2_BRAPC|nr:hypothetical protein BpHYR1_037590 [Brachionus plicatilis]
MVKAIKIWFKIEIIVYYGSFEKSSYCLKRESNQKGIKIGRNHIKQARTGAERKQLASKQLRKDAKAIAFLQPKSKDNF